MSSGESNTADSSWVWRVKDVGCYRYGVQLFIDIVCVRDETNKKEEMRRKRER